MIMLRKKAPYLFAKIFFLYAWEVFQMGVEKIRLCQCDVQKAFYKVRRQQQKRCQQLMP